MKSIETRIIGYLALAGLLAVCLVNGHPGWAAFILFLVAAEAFDVL